MHLGDDRKVLQIITRYYDLLVYFDVLRDLTERPRILCDSSVTAQPPGQCPELRKKESPAQGFEGPMIRALFKCAADVV